MNLASLKYLSVLLIMASGCSGSSDSTSARARKPVTQTDDGTGEGTGANLSCSDQWALALKQQPVGAKFGYSGTLKLSSLGNLALPYDRVEEVTASSDAAITRKITVSSTATSVVDVKSYLQRLGTNQLTLPKEKFIQSCSKANGQPVTVAGLGGDLTIGALKDQAITLKSGKTVSTKQVDIDVKNVTLGSYNVGSAKITTFISTLYPVLPLKQQLILNQISEPFLNGAILDEQLIIGLPAQ